METVKAAILIACIMGIITTIFEIAAPKGSLKKQLQMIIGIVTVLAVITPFTDGGFKISLDEFDVAETTEITKNTLDLTCDNILIKKSEKSVEEYFNEKLNNNGIKPTSLSASIHTNENNEAVIDCITIGCDNTNKEKVRQLISEDLKECEIIFISEEQDESKNQ